MVGPVTVTLCWLATNAYATATDADNPRKDTVYTLTDQGHTVHQLITKPQQPAGSGRARWRAPLGTENQPSFRQLIIPKCSLAKGDSP